MEQQKLNTMDSFCNEGFKIIRDGKVITLTHDEMYDFRYLEKATTGRSCLECYSDSCEDNKEITEAMMQDEDICYNIEEEFLDIVYSDAGAIEYEIIRDYIKRNLRKDV